MSCLRHRFVRPLVVCLGFKHLQSWPRPSLASILRRCISKKEIPKLYRTQCFSLIAFVWRLLLLLPKWWTSYFQVFRGVHLKQVSRRRYTHHLSLVRACISFWLPRLGKEPKCHNLYRDLPDDCSCIELWDLWGWHHGHRCSGLCRIKTYR